MTRARARPAGPERAPLRRRGRIGLAAALALTLVPGCRWLRRADPDAGCWIPDGMALCVPRAGGWAQDTSLPPPPPDAAGIVLRLVREGGIAGSPRIDVAREAPPVGGASAPVALDDVLAHGLQEMAALEAAGQIHIDAVDQRRIALGGGLAAFRVHHEYTSGSGAAQVAINQISTLMVQGGRGVAVTAAGRTELFHPLAESIQSIMDGLRPTGPQADPAPVPEAASAPVDLGTLGGAPKG